MQRAGFFRTRPTHRQVNVYPEVQSAVDQTSAGGTCDLGSRSLKGYLLINKTVDVPAGVTLKGTGMNRCVLAKSSKTVVISSAPTDEDQFRDLLRFNSKGGGNPVYDPSIAIGSYANAPQALAYFADSGFAPVEGATTIRVEGDRSSWGTQIGVLIHPGKIALVAPNVDTRHHIEVEMVKVTSGNVIPGAGSIPVRTEMAIEPFNDFPNKFEPGSTPYEIEGYPAGNLQFKLGRNFTQGAILLIPKRSGLSGPSDIGTGGGLKDIALDGRTQRPNHSTNLHLNHQLASVVGMQNFVLENVKINYFWITGISFFTCRDILVNKCTIDEAPFTVASYGVLFKGCRGVKFQDCIAGSVRKHAMFAHSNSDCMVLRSVIEPYPRYAETGAPQSGTSEIDIGHGGADHRLQVRDIDAPDSIVICANPKFLSGSYWTVVKNCRFKDVYVYAAADEVHFLNCQLRTVKLDVCGYVDDGVVNVVRPKNVLVKDSMLYNRSDSYSVSLGFLGVALVGAEAGIDGTLTFDNCVFDSSASQATKEAILFKSSHPGTQISLINSKVITNRRSSIAIVPAKPTASGLLLNSVGTSYSYRPAGSGSGHSAIFLGTNTAGTITGSGNTKASDMASVSGATSSWTIPPGLFT